MNRTADKFAKIDMHSSCGCIEVQGVAEVVDPFSGFVVDLLINTEVKSKVDTVEMVFRDVLGGVERVRLLVERAVH